jgi:hypothetical protein
MLTIKIKIRFREEPDGVHVYYIVEDLASGSELENNVWERASKLINDMIDLDEDCAIGRKNKAEDGG